MKPVTILTQPSSASVVESSHGEVGTESLSRKPVAYKATPQVVMRME